MFKYTYQVWITGITVSKHKIFKYYVKYFQIYLFLTLCPTNPRPCDDFINDPAKYGVTRNYIFTCTWFYGTFTCYAGLDTEVERRHLCAKITTLSTGTVRFFVFSTPFFSQQVPNITYRIRYLPDRISRIHPWVRSVPWWWVIQRWLFAIL